MFCCIESGTTCNRFDTTYTRTDTGFRCQTEGTDESCIAYMRTAAQFNGEARNLYYANYVAIFITKECHSTFCFCFVHRHFSNSKICGLKNFFVYKGFDLIKFLLCYRREMCEIETQVIRCYQRTCLVNMFAKHSF